MNKPGPAPYAYNFRRLPGGLVLLSAENGATALLEGRDFASFAAGRRPRPRALASLAAGGFLREQLDFEGLCADLGARYFRGWRGPHVHIISLTSACNLACGYCGAAGGRGGAMTPATAAAVLDFVLSSPAPSLMLEFQGGEPLLNLPALKYFVREARRRAGRPVHFSVVTNLTAADDAALAFLVDNAVTVCTSLDGPEDLHDAGRPGSYRAVTAALRRLRRLGRRRRDFEAPNAICTVTRRTLAAPAAVVDEFLARGFNRVQLGPLDRLGRADAGWERYGYSPGEFAAFYGAALDHMLRLNRRGVAVYEKAALSIIRQVLLRRRPRYQNLDLFYRLAYGPDGSVYGSDEARLLGAAGDGFLRLGDARRDTFPGLLDRPLARYLAASCLNALRQPCCARCAYSPFCRVPAALAYAEHGTPDGDLASSWHCALFKGVFDLLMSRASSKADMKIFERWDALYE